MRLFYCDHYEIPLPLGHKFPVRKYRMLREAIAAAGRYQLEPAPMADAQTVALAHNPDYVAGFLNGTLDPKMQRRIGFPWSQGLVDRTMASVGGSLAAAREAMETGFGGTLAGGTHHAFRDSGAGFCVFNDVAIVVHAFRAWGRARRFSVIDLDVHQGDGTAAFFEHDPDVLTISLHGANNFPFRKQRSKIDIEFPDGAGDAEYLAAVDRVAPMAVEFRPDLVVFLSGVDALETDKLGRLSLSVEGMARRDLCVIQAVHDARLPLLVTLGGGYSEPIERTVDAHATTFQIAAQTFSPGNSV